MPLLKKHNDQLASMYTLSYKEPKLESVLSKLKGAKITDIKMDSKTTELAIITSKGTLILGAEVDNGDPIIIKGFM